MDELKQMKIWICWNYTLTKDNKPTGTIKPIPLNLCSFAEDKASS